jgi:hypothetical protein
MIHAPAAVAKNTKCAMDKTKRNMKASQGFKTASCRCFLPLLLLFSTSLFAQTGKIEYIQDARVDTLVNRYKRANESHASIEGYRIQITAGSNRTNVYQIKSQFYTAFPDIKQYIIYQAPNFKLRVGNYRTRLEAYKDLQEILQRFNGSFIIRDEIKLSEL